VTGDGSVNLSGIASTSSRGTVTVTADTAIDLSGLAGTAGQGTLSVDAAGSGTVILSGIASTATEGTATVAGDAAITPSVIAASGYGQIVNRIPYSQDISQAVWNKDGITANSSRQADPWGGSSTIYFLEEDTSTGFHRLYEGLSDVQGDNGFSIYAKASSRDEVVVQVWNATDGTVAEATFDLTAGTFSNVTGSAQIEAAANSWYRCSVYGTTTVSASNSLVNIYNGGTQYTGDGSSGVYVTGAQNENQLATSEYLRTEGSPVGNFVVNAGGDLPFTGEEGTASDGSMSVAADAVLSLTGEAAISSEGSAAVTGSGDLPLTGEQANTGQGSPSVSGDAAISLSGEAVVASVGTLSTSSGGFAPWLYFQGVVQ
jgi:hypothetical protein